MAEFVAALDPVNALADDQPGFVWRLQAEDGNATSILAFDDDRMIVNMSVWESIESLSQFVYRSGHVNVMRRRREWFVRIPIHMALWWVPTRHIRGAVQEGSSSASSTSVSTAARRARCSKGGSKRGPIDDQLSSRTGGSAVGLAPRPRAGLTTTCSRGRGRCRRSGRARRARPCPGRTARSRRSERSPRSVRGGSTSGSRRHRAARHQRSSTWAGVRPTRSAISHDRRVRQVTAGPERAVSHERDLALARTPRAAGAGTRTG